MRIRPNVPMAIQVANALRQRLRREYGSGGRLPSENQMAAELGVSRGTVRQALAILQQEGAITRQQGSGTFANSRVLGIQARVDMAYEFGQLIEGAGFQSSIQTLEIRSEQAGEDLARRLNLAAGAEVLGLRKVFLADGQPAIYVYEHLPTALILEPYAPAELQEPIFRFIERRCHTRVEYILSEIIPCTAGGEAGAQLGLAAATPVLKFVEIFYSPRNEPLVLATIFFRDPLIRFHALRKMSQLA